MEKLTSPAQSADKPAVQVLAPARLHLGFIDMHGGLGRSFGSLGLSLMDIHTQVSATRSDDVVIQGPSSHRASVIAGRMLEYLNIREGVEITIHETIPEHAGLGSGTQLSLAVGTAIAKLYNKTISPHEIASLMERGARSGIGVGVFTLGGFLVDGGRGEHTDVPPVICHLDFPEAWRLLLIFDTALQGVHGLSEKSAFHNLPPMAETTTAYLCRLTLMQLLPALVEQDCAGFGAAITEIQRLVGDHFAPAQGGRYCSPLIAEILPWLQMQGAAGIGQSSWGPTGFALVANETQAYQLQRLARERWHDQPHLKFKVCRARNEKAMITAGNTVTAGSFKLKTL